MAVSFFVKANGITLRGLCPSARSLGVTIERSSSTCIYANRGESRGLFSRLISPTFSNSTEGQLTEAHLFRARSSGDSYTVRTMSATTLGVPTRESTAVPETMVAEKGTVVSADWLHQHINDPNLKVLDGSWYMPTENRDSYQEYKDSHIPGALFFDLDGISDITSKLPHMLPSEAAFSAAASSLGIQNHHNIVVYDGKGIFSSARVWWIFRAFGHEKVWILDGGLPQWLGKKYPLEPAPSEALSKSQAAVEAVKKIYQGEQVGSITFRAQLQQHLVWYLDQVKNNIVGATHLVVDARSKGRFDGTAPEPRAGIRSGHFPGAVCVPFFETVTSSGTLRTPEELTKLFEQAGVPLDGPIAVSCGTGVTACLLAMALHRLGRTDIPVYDGSWTEWSTTPNLPIATNE